MGYCAYASTAPVGGYDHYITTNNAKDFYKHSANAIIRDNQLTLFGK